MRHLNQQEKDAAKLNIIREDQWIGHYTELGCKNEDHENIYSNDTNEIEEVDE